MSDRHLSSGEVLREIGGELTYRRLYYWMQQGAIHPSFTERSGSGNHVEWSREDARKLRIITRILEHLTPTGDLDLVAALWRCPLDRPFWLTYEVMWIVDDGPEPPSPVALRVDPETLENDDD